MSSEDETNDPQPNEIVGEAKAAPKKNAPKKAAKKAAKKTVKRASKKRGLKKPVEAGKSAPSQGDMFTPGEVVRGAGDSSGDDEVTFSSDIAVDKLNDTGAAGGSVSDIEEPSRSPKRFEKTAAKTSPGRSADFPNQGGNQKSGAPGKGPHRHNQGESHRGKPGNQGHPKFNKNQKNNQKRKRGKNRWQNKGKRDRQEETPIELGDLLDWELLGNRDELAALAKELKSGGGTLDYVRLYNLELPQLREEVAGLGLHFNHAPNRDQLIDAVVAKAGEKKEAIETTGILELMDGDGGLLVYERDNYRVRALSAYVPQSFVEHYGLERGHIVKAQLHPHREGESCPFVVAIQSVMGRDPETLAEIVPFTERVPYYPTSRILMEADSAAKWDNLSMRVVDCLTPVGFGQRGLIVAPPRTGKTVLMQGMANSIQKNYPEAHLIILLIDERPEEVTDFRRQVQGEVISSTFDESAESHVHAAEMVIEKARRMVEIGEDVVILLDSITRLARAYNTTMPSSGKILSGGVEANALQKPKRFFGSARNIEDGGSLTIIATALVETGSKMDEVIFEEFKGTGNMELHLDRGLSDKRVFPALSMDRSGTRKEELLYHPDEMLKIYSLRRAMKGLPSTDAMEMLIQRIKKTSTNAEFLMSVAR